jgi:hypothetical protein
MKLLCLLVVLFLVVLDYGASQPARRVNVFGTLFLPINNTDIRALNLLQLRIFTVFILFDILFPIDVAVVSIIPNHHQGNNL